MPRHLQDWLQEAIDILRREVPDDLEWLFQGPQPTLRWADDLSTVDGRILKAWCVQAAARAVVEPDAGQLRRAQLFEAADRQRFARWLLERWILEDTDGSDLTEERRRELRHMAERAAQLARRLGRGGQDPDDRYRQLLSQERARAEPSAVPQCGLLALVAACGADPVPKPTTEDGLGSTIDAYLSQWRDQRPEQCRLLKQLADGLDRRSR